MDVDTIIKALEYCKNNQHANNCEECFYGGYTGTYCDRLIDDALAMLKEQEVRELSMDEWREWKENSRRDPICMLWENDTSPMWVLNPNNVHEPALLMGKLKLFTGKPTFEQCKAVKWE